MRQEQKKLETEKETSAPDMKFRSGAVSVSVWKNEGISQQNGKPYTFYTVSTQRSYLDKDGATWKNTQSFKVNDLLKLARLLEKAFDACATVDTQED